MESIIAGASPKEDFKQKVVIVANEREREAYEQTAETLGIAHSVSFRVSDAPKFGSWSK